MRTKWWPMNIYYRCSSRQITDTRCTVSPRIATLAASRANVGGWRNLARGVDTSDVRFWRTAGVTRMTDLRAHCCRIRYEDGEGQAVRWNGARRSVHLLCLEMCI